MAIKGSLQEASLPDVLQLLAMGQKTGCLSVTDRANFGRIYFDRGRIIYSSIVNRRDRLGDLLVKNGLLEPAELAASLEAQDAGKDGLRLGEILIQRGSITREQLEQYILLQIEEAVYYLFTWSQGSFYFEADQRPEEEAILVSINPENLLLEGARRIDEWSLIEKKIPSLELVFSLDPAVRDREEVGLSEEQRRILPLLDGKHSVQEVIDESGLVEFDVGKAIFGLVQAGFAHPVGRKQSVQAQEVRRSRMDEHRNLGIAFYKTTMYEEAAREFRRVVELEPRNLEARFYLGLIALSSGDDRAAIRQFKELIELGGRWASAFHNLGIALERLGRMPDALLAVEEALHISPQHPRLLLSRAILLLKNRRTVQAAEAFGVYREALGSARPPAVYFAFAALAVAATGEGAEAARLGEEGLALYPHSAPLLLSAGAVYERSGAWEEAEARYRRAVEEDGELPQAHKSLGDALYHRGAYEEAAECYQRMIELAPDLGDDAYFKLGNIRYKANEREEAVRLWRRVLELNPDHTVARTNLELVEHVLAGSAAAKPAGEGP